MLLHYFFIALCQAIEYRNSNLMKHPTTQFMEDIMKIETAAHETLSTDSRAFVEVADGVYVAENGKVLVYDTDGKSAILISRKFRAGDAHAVDDDFDIEEAMRSIMSK